MSPNLLIQTETMTGRANQHLWKLCRIQRGTGCRSLRLQEDRSSRREGIKRMVCIMISLLSGRYEIRHDLSVADPIKSRNERVRNLSNTRSQ